MKKLILALALLAAQAVQAAPITLSWTPALTREDGSAVGPVMFAVYGGAGSGNEKLLQTGIMASSATFQVVAGQSWCFQVTEIEISTGAESLKSAEVCRTFPPSLPNVPTGVTIK
jgi:hypothetical protein